VIVLDASVLIAHLDSTDAHHDDARRVLHSAAGQDLAASVLTVAEVTVGPARDRRGHVVDEVLDALHITRVPLRPDDAATLADLRATTGLRMPDCCVLHAAQTVGGAVATFDQRLADAARQLDIVVVD